VSNIRSAGDPGQAEADEYVEIKNIGTQQQSVDGWSLKVFVNNEQRDQYVFSGPSAELPAGQVCRIYTNLAYGPDNCGLSYGFASPQPIWPNSGARASLFNQQNIEVARFSY
jgi:hypothetical protein